MSSERIEHPQQPYKFFYFAHWIATSLTYRMPALLWITEWGIWPSSENWHVYYKLRHTYEDRRLLHEAPGHLFLEHETEDLASFLQLALLNGWGGYVLTHANYVNLFFSHDEYIDFFAKPEVGGLVEVRTALGEADKAIAPSRPGDCLIRSLPGPSMSVSKVFGLSVPQALYYSLQEFQMRNSTRRSIL